MYKDCRTVLNHARIIISEYSAEGVKSALNQLSECAARHDCPHHEPCKQAIDAVLETAANPDQTKQTT